MNDDFFRDCFQDAVDEPADLLAEALEALGANEFDERFVDSKKIGNDDGRIVREVFDNKLKRKVILVEAPIDSKEAYREIHTVMNMPYYFVEPIYEIFLHDQKLCFIKRYTDGEKLADCLETFSEEKVKSLILRILEIALQMQRASTFIQGFSISDIIITNNTLTFIGWERYSNNEKLFYKNIVDTIRYISGSILEENNQSFYEVLKSADEGGVNTLSELDMDVRNSFIGVPTTVDQRSFIHSSIVLFKYYKIQILFTFIFMSLFGILIINNEMKLQDKKYVLKELDRIEIETAYSSALDRFNTFDYEECLKLLDVKSDELPSKFLILKQKACLITGRYEDAAAIASKMDSPVINTLPDLQQDLFAVVLKGLIGKDDDLALRMVRQRYKGLAFKERRALAERLLLQLNGAGDKLTINRKNFFDFKAGPNCRTLIPLITFKIQNIDASGSEIQEISALRYVSRMENVDISNTSVSNIFPLRNKNLLQLNISNTCISYLSPLGKAQIKVIDITGLHIRYLSVFFNLTGVSKIKMNQRLTKAREIRDYKNLKKAGRIY